MSSKSSLRTRFEILLLFVTIISVVFTFVEAQTNYTIIKPMIARILPQPAQIKINEIKFFYNPLSLRYENVTVSLSNNGGSNFDGKVVVSIYGSTNNMIASGEKTFSLQVQMTFFLNVPLSWIGNATVTDYAHSAVTVV